MPDNKIHQTICADLNDWVMARFNAGLEKTLDADGNDTSEKTQITTYVINLDPEDGEEDHMAMDGAEDDMGSEDDDVEARVDDLESALDDLKAEFEKLMADEQGEESEDDEDMGDDEDDEDMGDDEDAEEDAEDEDEDEEDSDHSEPVVISLVDHTEQPSQNRDSVKVSFDHSLTQDQGSDVSDSLNKLTTELKQWAQSNLMGFEVRDVSVQAGKRGEHGNAIAESKFSALTGTVKTSVQTLENARLIVKHTDIINDDVRGARTRRIHRIYVENNSGERFLMPFNNLRGARAMARHVNEGGNPYDQRGQSISNLAEEAAQLGRFVRRTRNRTFEDTVALDMITSASQRLTEVRSLLTRVSGERGYARHAESLDQTPVVEYDQSVKHHFIRNQYDEQLDNSLPYAWRAYQMTRLQETDQFESWANRIVSELDDNTMAPKPDARLAPLQKALGLNTPQAQSKDPLKVQMSAKKTPVISYDPRDADAKKKIAGLVSGGTKVPAGTTFAPMSEAPTQATLRVVSGDGEETKINLNPAKLGDDALGHTIEQIKEAHPDAKFYYSKNGGAEQDLHELLGRDKADDLLQDVKSPGQEATTVDDCESYGHGLAEDDMEEGNKFTVARKKAIEAGKNGFKVGDKQYSVTGDTDAEEVSESLARILHLSGIRK